MRESRTYGSVRGALSNERPYREPAAFVPRIGTLLCGLIKPGPRYVSAMSERRQNRRTRRI